MSASADGRKKFIEVIHKLIEGENPQSKCCAVRALSRINATDAKSANKLIALLRDPYPDVRMEAAVALGETRISSAIEPLLASITGDPDGDVRIEAVTALSKIGSKKSVEPLIRCVQENGYPELDLIVDDLEYSPCWEVQSRALNALGKIGDKRAADAIIEFLQDDDYEDMQETGYRVLAQIDSDQARQYLLEKLAGGSRLAKRRAAQALGASPDLTADSHDSPIEILTGLTEALLDEDTEVRIAAARALGATRNPLVATSLTMLLTDPDPLVRREVAAILGAFRGGDIVKRLHGMLGEPDSKVKCQIVHVLGDIGASASFEPLFPLLASDDEDVLYEVIRAIGNIGVPGGQDEIAALLADEDRHFGVRVQAALALWRLLKRAPACDTGAEQETENSEQAGNQEIAEEAPRSPEEILLAAALDANQQVAFAALSSLIKIDPQQAAVMLTGMLNGEFRVDEEDQENSGTSEEEETVTLADLPGSGDPKTSTLAAIVASQPAEPQETENAEDEFGHMPPQENKLTRPEGDPVRIQAARLLGGISGPNPDALEALINAAGTDDPDLRREVMVALGRIGDKAALPAILSALESEHPEIRLVALEALCEVAGDDKFEDRFLNLLNDPSPFVRERAVRAVGAGFVSRAADDLIKPLNDEDPIVCKAALEVVASEFRPQDIPEQLLETMFRFSGELRREVGTTLRKVGDFSSLPVLLAALNDPKQDERHWICLDVTAEMFADEPAAQEQEEAVLV